APAERGKLKVIIETPPSGIGETDWQSTTLETIDLSEGASGKLNQYKQDIYKIGFGREGGFETFHVPIDDRYRGKTARLRFKLESSNPAGVFLDDVFFSSAHLKFGNPSEARFDSRVPGDNPYRENLLIEKPQYAVSYNRTTKTPNWVSWQVNNAWLGKASRPEQTIFKKDSQLPQGWPEIDHDNYTDKNGKNFGFDQGHVIPSRDRTNHEKDNIATFLGTNLIPQSVDNNRYFTSKTDPAKASAWYNIEGLVRRLVAQDKQELYVVAGTYSTNWTDQKRSNAHPEEVLRGNTKSGEFQKQGIHIPRWTWKTILALDTPGMGVADVTENTKAYTFLTPNKPEPYKNWPEIGSPVAHPFNQIKDKLGLSEPLPDIQNATEWRDPSTWQVTIEQLEKLLQGKKINTLSSVPEDIRQHIKKQKYSIT
ncbi:MAG: DNA/RNA non-specific endonuclease, partial [Okeania sp. SIO3C4]|nr:DNA/RNA non-specific endonuclease [Okeania sp. SIO3C4]